MAEQQAVIDIGSNTVRLVIYGGPPRAPVVLLNERVTARLGKGLAVGGKLSGKAMAAALAALGRYAALLRAKDIRAVQTVATAAVRDAANGAMFLEAVAALGLKPRLLSGEEEALTSATGVAGAFPKARGVVADLGGGSLELVHIRGRTCEHGTSLPLGSLRLAMLRAGGTAKFNNRVKRLIGDAGCACGPDEVLYLVGGSHRALARFIMHHAGSSLDDPHGYEISSDQALAACRSQLRARAPVLVPGISPSRLAALPDTAALLIALVRAVGPARIVFSAWGLREGLLFAGLSPMQQQLDPLTAGVHAFTEQLGTPASLAAMVAGWTAAAGASHETSRENLRLAATMLALASQQVEPNLRAATLIDWALHKRWIGLGQSERAMLAACLLANSNRPLPEAVTRLASPATLREGTGWGLAIRLCRRLTGLSPQVFSGTELQADGTQLVLSVNEAWAPLATEAIKRDMHALADHGGLSPVLRRV